MFVFFCNGVNYKIARGSGGGSSTPASQIAVCWLAKYWCWHEVSCFLSDVGILRHNFVVALPSCIDHKFFHSSLVTKYFF